VFRAASRKIPWWGKKILRRDGANVRFFWGGNILNKINNNSKNFRGAKLMLGWASHPLARFSLIVFHKK